jgi:SNF2 family DNA or RNA helicase
VIKLSMHNADTMRIDAGPLDVSRLKVVPGTRAHPTADPPYWTVAATLYHGVVLRNIFLDEMEYDEGVRAHMSKLRGIEKLRMFRKDHGIDPRLFPFQHTGVWRLCVPGGCVLADEVGTGKTVQSLMALSTIPSIVPEAQPLPALVVTTRTMKRRWAEEMETWGPGRGVPYVIVGTATQRKKQLAAAADDPNAVVVMNWESLRLHTRLAGYPGVSMTDNDTTEKELNRIPFNTVILDEAHRMKDAHAKQTRAAWYMGKDATWRWCLTGTPTGGDYVDIWSLMRFISPEEAPARGPWLNRYVVMIDGYNGHAEPLFLRPETKPELFWWLDQYMLRRTIKELPELAREIPEVVTVPLRIELTKDQMAAYKSMKKDMMARFGESILIEPDPLVRVGRLRYIASAMPVVENDQVLSLTTPSNKVEALLELLSDSENRPAVVFAESSKLIELAAKVAAMKGYSTGKITGAESDGVRAATVARFQDEELDVIFCTSAGGEGITLTAGACMIFLQTPRSLLMYTQMSGRVPRIGNKRPRIMAYHLISEGTNDETVYEVIVQKAYRADEIAGDSRRIFGSL